MDKLQPVAWMQVHYKDGTPTKFSKVQTWEDDIPLYTHPAKFKELTDAEIMESCHAYHYTYNPDYLGFAREILRKASEK